MLWDKLRQGMQDLFYSLQSLAHPPTPLPPTVIDAIMQLSHEVHDTYSASLDARISYHEPTIALHPRSRIPTHPAIVSLYQTYDEVERVASQLRQHAPNATPESDEGQMLQRMSRIKENVGSVIRLAEEAYHGQVILPQDLMEISQREHTAQTHQRGA